MTGDGPDVYEDRFFNIAKSSDGEIQPTLILVCVRLGIDRITPVYWDALQASMRLPQSIGIAGGRPSSSHYFVGTQGLHFFYLDPHETRTALPLRKNNEMYSTEEVDSCHTRRLRRLHVSEMDPSMLIAFLIRDERDWTAWKGSIVHESSKAIIQVAEQDPVIHGQSSERQAAFDEVEILDDEGSETEVETLDGYDSIGPHTA
ncbi:MAG: Cysteine protease atg4 [Sarcosagium campestre]|nr:MAG: Cysteine protease atg4 [Sarcosagium campestre]